MNPPSGPLLSDLSFSNRSDVAIDSGVVVGGKKVLVEVGIGVAVGNGG